MEEKKKDIKKIPVAGAPVSRLNKKLVIGVIIGLGFLLLMTFIFSMSPPEQVERTTEQNTRVSAPDFERLLRESQIKTNEQTVPYIKETPPPSTSFQPDMKEFINEPVKENTTSQIKKIQEKKVTSSTRKPDLNNPMLLENYKRLLVEEKAARNSALFVSVSFPDENEIDKSPSNSTFESNNPYPGELAAFPHAPQQSQAIDNYTTANMQAEKSYFFNNNTSDDDIIFAETPKIPLSNLITPGTLISAVLVTAINSDLPGDVKAIVNENIYSADGKYILIPQGTILLAQYNSNVSWAQERLQIGWSRIIRPDGVSVKLGNMPGVDAKGASGLTGEVDRHPWETVKGLGMLAAFTILSAEINFQANQLGSPALIDVTENVNEEVDNIGAKYTDRALDIQPTIKVPPGQKIKVFINKDLGLPPFQY